VSSGQRGAYLHAHKLVEEDPVQTKTDAIDALGIARFSQQNLGDRTDLGFVC
jgi:hypothetical protein